MYVNQWKCVYFFLMFRDFVHFQTFRQKSSGYAVSAGHTAGYSPAREGCSTCSLLTALNRNVEISPCSGENEQQSICVCTFSDETRMKQYSVNSVVVSTLDRFSKEIRQNIVLGRYSSKFCFKAEVCAEVC